MGADRGKLEDGAVRLSQLFILALLIAAFGLGACGRRGDLEPPPGYEDNSNRDDDVLLDPII